MTEYRIEVREKDPSRFLITDKARARVGRLVILFFLTSMVYVMTLCIGAMSDKELLGMHSHKRTLYMVIGGGFTLLPYVVAIVKLIIGLYGLTSFKFTAILRAAKAVVCVIVLAVIFKAYIWDSRAALSERSSDGRLAIRKRFNLEGTLQMIFTGYILLLVQQIADDLGSSSITSVLVTIGIVVATSVLYSCGNELESAMKPVTKPIVEIVGSGIPSERWKAVISITIKKGLPAFVVAASIAVISAICMRIEKSCMKGVKASRKVVIFACGAMLFLLMFMVIVMGINMTDERFKYLFQSDAERGARSLARQGVGFFKKLFRREQGGSLFKIFDLEKSKRVFEEAYLAAQSRLNSSNQ